MHLLDNCPRLVVASCTACSHGGALGLATHVNEEAQPAVAADEVHDGDLDVLGRGALHAAVGHLDAADVGVGQLQQAEMGGRGATTGKGRTSGGRIGLTASQASNQPPRVLCKVRGQLDIWHGGA